MEGEQRPQKHKAHHHKAHHPHHVVPKHETGYTDEALEECHDLIYNAEERAHLHDPDSMYSTTDHPEPVHRAKASTGGLESTSKEMTDTGKQMSGKLGEKMGEMKEKMLGGSK
ncbi:hypothetical protein VTJ83DRAFT_1937 [Remersonia thermophila]|uniref:Uncharacterized protein n=1 Tax=Remersonia thermophila TaxID=72144 RepID=A0ABR4DHC4_9PEZI